MVSMTWFIRIGFIVAVLAGLALSGCSATKQISEATSRVQENATGIRTDVSEAKQAADAGDIEGVKTQLDEIDVKAADIQTVAAKIHQKLTGVEDQTPWWGNTLKWAFIAAVSLAGIFLLWRLNIFIYLEKGIQVAVDWGAKLLGA